MKLRLYNTETRAKEEISPGESGKILLYTCGPTVYNYAHIGNFRTYIFEDLLCRTLKFLGMPVRQVMNITDVEDKIIKAATEQNIPLEDFTRPFIEAFFEDLQSLNIEPADDYPSAVEHIPMMVEMIQKLLDQGNAYRGSDGSIYYAIDKFPSYGRLSHLEQKNLKTGASDRIGQDEYDKENACDFVLWKAYDPTRDGMVFWESPFGPGRPGWHIECSAMALQLLGETIDIHCGGVDNIFPHHDNEIAQTEAFTGKRFVRHWAHSEHLLFENRKMSKSLGNFYTLRDLLNKGYSGKQIRYLLLQTHYRTQLNFTFQGLDGAAHTLERIADCAGRLRAWDDSGFYGFADPLIERARKQFIGSLADDLNISPALAALFDLIREVNVLCDQNQIGAKEAASVLQFFEDCDAVLGVLPLKEEKLRVSRTVEDALQHREEARAQKNWDLADYWRDFILNRGYVIEDTPHGPKLKKR
jgi:cysteinyl-tRNA synthetase